MSDLQKAHFAWQACSSSSSLLSGQQLQQQSRLKLQDTLRFNLVQSSRHKFPPFASLSSSRSAAANPLFSISRLTGSSGSDGGSSEGSSSSTAAGDGSSGYESSSDTGYSSEVDLSHVKCQLCQRSLKSPGGKRGGGLFGRGRRSRGSNSFLVCDCCQRAYHKDCCRDQGISTKEGKDSSWFHSSSCRECMAGLQQQAKLGAVCLPNGRTWQLIDCSPVAPEGQSGIKALQQLKRSLGDVLDVQLPAYGPGAAQQLVDNEKGFAVLLRQDNLPVTAGLLDVYGQECAVLDLVATQLEEQGKGHCSAMLQALEGWLGPQLGVASLMAVCPGDEPETIKTWQQKFGFKRLNQRQLKQLQASVPPLNYYEESVLLSKKLPKEQKGQQQQPNAVHHCAASTDAQQPTQP